MDQTPAPAPLSLTQGIETAWEFLRLGGPAIWAIAALSVITLALILWKTWDLSRLGAWNGGRHVQRAVALWGEGQERAALDSLADRRTCRALLARSAMAARRDATLDDDAARAETARVARQTLAHAQRGQRPLELIATIAPLLGLLGTVLGMIAAFQALQTAGARADPATLAGGIWEALLTTAAGMAVAIPASMALSWFESVEDRLRLEMEDAATRIFLRPPSRGEQALKAAE
ncbi:MotA/TolQ/ExbB proton channel family protein [Thalassovita sp.]|uniref:MotA/TolQ/ExbB proton channel family protein n=1 Tax=Thalassovita sp. TaxID=1979401 RepID=UPI0029DE5D11|nr:MotA/TolQ/ExbB proton channel family protein [Thalassovita sp.]